MKISLAILAVLLLAGCSSAQTDPFVGTWKVPSVGTAVVASAFVVAPTAGDRYQLRQMHGPLTDGVATLSRHGNTLSGSFTDLGSGDSWPLTLTRLPDGRMKLLMGSEPYPYFWCVLHRVSNSSAAPRAAFTPSGADRAVLSALVKDYAALDLALWQADKWSTLASTAEKYGDKSHLLGWLTARLKRSAQVVVDLHRKWNAAPDPGGPLSAAHQALLKTLDYYLPAATSLQASAFSRALLASTTRAFTNNHELNLFCTVDGFAVLHRSAAAEGLPDTNAEYEYLTAFAPIEGRVENAIVDLVMQFDKLQDVRPDKRKMSTMVGAIWGDVAAITDTVPWRHRPRPVGSLVRLDAQFTALFYACSHQYAECTKALKGPAFQKELAELHKTLAAWMRFDQGTNAIAKELGFSTIS